MSSAVPRAVGAGDSSGDVTALRDQMKSLRESERYRLLASLLSSLAEAGGRDDDGRRAEEAQAAALRKRIEELGERTARLEDELKEAQDGLGRKSRQLEVEIEQNQDFQRRLKEMRTQQEAWQREKLEIENALVARNTQMHQLEREIDQLRVKAQRAEHAANDTRRVEDLEKSRRELILAVEEKTREVERVRMEKDAELERLKEKMQAVRGQTEVRADELLAALWSRLTRVKPPVVEGTSKPSVQTAERVFDAFIELTRFAHLCDEQTRSFLDRYTRGDETLRTAWQGFSTFGVMADQVKMTAGAANGPPVGLLKVRLGQLRMWMFGALLASDAAIECIQDELVRQILEALKGDRGLKLDDFRKNGGPERLQNAVIELRRRKLKETQERGLP